MDESSRLRHPIDRMAEEFAARRRTGKPPRVAEFSERAPQHQQEIEELLPLVSLLEEHGPQTAADTSELSLNVLGDYYLVREVGRGGMGVVYEARQLSLDRRVALKVLPPQQLSSPRHVVRFDREAQSAARLHHENIVPVFGVGRQDGTCFFVMQFIDGYGLDRVVEALRAEDDAPRDSGRFAELSLCNVVHRLRFQEWTTRRFRARTIFEGDPPGGDPAVEHVLRQARTCDGAREHYYTNVAGIGIQVAEALQYAHDHGVLHRDVKPSNLMLDDDGTVWVTDFGLAKVLGADDLTESSETVGTLRFMAPEQFAGAHGPACDVYSLGATLYELLTLRPLVTEETRLGQMTQITEGEPVPPREIAPEIPRELESIVLQAVAREPDRRYASAGELAADLRRFLYGLPTEARHLGRIARGWQWCQRRSALSRFVAAVTVLLFLFATILAVGYSRMRTALLEVETERDQAQASLRAARNEVDRLRSGKNATQSSESAETP